MLRPDIDDFVVLLEDQPDLGLYFGDVGVVCQHRWDWQQSQYEVEFESAQGGRKVRLWLAEQQIHLAPLSPFDPQPGTGRNLYF